MGAAFGISDKPTFDKSSWRALEPAFNEHIKSEDATAAWQAGHALWGLLMLQSSDHRHLAGLPPEPVAHAVLGAMRRHPENKVVQNRGCGALYRLCEKFGALRATLQRDPSVYATVRAAAEVDSRLEGQEAYTNLLCVWLQPPQHEERGLHQPTVPTASPSTSGTTPATSGSMGVQPGASSAHQSGAADAEQNLKKAIALKDIHTLEGAIATAEANGVGPATLYSAQKALYELQKAERTRLEAMQKAGTGPHGRMEIPSHWSPNRLDQGWLAVAVDDPTLALLKEMFLVRQPEELGQGRDANKYGKKYNQLQLHCAWRIEHLTRWQKYASEREDVLRHTRQLKQQKIVLQPWKSKLENISRNLPEQLREDVGERFFLHGTSPETVLAILHEGFSEKLASLKGAFGAGNYFAEDPEKIDQYAKPDVGHETHGLEDLHSRLYRAHDGSKVSGTKGTDLFYCFVVRVACGACLHTEGLDKEKLKDISTGKQIFLNADRRELCRVPGASPPFSYDTLVVNVGPAVKRFREIISFSGQRVYAEYLLAYQRIMI